MMNGRALLAMVPHEWAGPLADLLSTMLFVLRILCSPARRGPCSFCPFSISSPAAQWTVKKIDGQMGMGEGSC